MTQKILITGATGFVGRHLVQQFLAEEEFQPIVLVRTRDSWEKNDWARKLSRVELIEGDVTDPDSWAADPRLINITAIYHLAAVVRHTRNETSDMYRTNVDGTLNMVRVACHYRCRMILVSTSGTVGCFDNPHESADENTPYSEKVAGRWPYYDSKIQAEKKGRDLAEQLGVELVIFRPPVFLGPGDHRFRATGPILRLLRGKLPFILRGGIHFVDIRDAVRAM
ncbi:MAG: NAD-dependent epimerase/dehydratase family protein, partial [Deltaproteobacteria bacterium]|nr:NAD-dependent epimerase/dehydratase family protein [Deltaproteobacteria bacterium]